LLVSCAKTYVQPTSSFQLSERGYLYDIARWSFTGRVAFSDEKESFSSSISWKHQQSQDELEFVGPFGQGRTLIKLTDDSVVVDYGDKRMQSVGNVDELVSRYTGIKMPVSALKYWVLGLVTPDTEYVEIENGFMQLGWTIKYQQMQAVEVLDLPRKIRVEKNKVKLKLIIKDWDMQG